MRQQRWAEAVEHLTAARALRPELGLSLAGAHMLNGRVDEGVALFERLRAEKANNPFGLFLVGFYLGIRNRPREAEAAFRDALRLDPNMMAARSNLGLVLYAQGRYRESEAACREVLRLDPHHPAGHYNLANALEAQGRHAAAEPAYRAALRARPNSAEVYNNLGLCLAALGRSEEAEAAYREALRLKPGLVQPTFNLARAVQARGRWREAEAIYRNGLRFHPDAWLMHEYLGVNLYQQSRHPEAEAAFRAVLRLRPASPHAHGNLALVLQALGRFPEAEAACRAALGLDPEQVEALYHLGNALGGQGRYPDAEAAFRAALRRAPGFPEAHCNLASVLREQGRLADALQSFRRGHALGSKRPGWRYPSAQWVASCERLVELDRRLPDLLGSDGAHLGATEQLELAGLCRYPTRRLHRTAARLAAEAFSRAPLLALDLRSQHRYNAASSAALAAAGQAEDARLLPDKVVLKLRRQAWDWLRADLALYPLLVGQADLRVKQAVQQRLLHWRADPDLVSVRDQAALDRLDADERQQWQGLWQQVDALLRKVASKQ
jgi:tetratricopeptide (TPR) repeat protein